MSNSEIKIQVKSDDNNVPEEIIWSATDGPQEKKAKAVLLSVWDETEGTMTINLWNKDMKVDEMKYLFHQTLLTMSQSFERATGDERMAATMRDFCDYFAEKTELKKKG